MVEPANVLLSLSNGPENAMLVREMLSGVGEQVALERVQLIDIRTAVTEACNNVALHAYADREGRMEVELRCLTRAISVVVRDHGDGIDQSQPAHTQQEPGIGLAVIRALSNEVEFRDTAGGGTEVHMRFSAPQVCALAAAGPAPEHPLVAGAAAPAEQSRIAISPLSLGPGVLPRVLSVLAAGANFTTDRISDVQLLADALLAEFPGAGAGAWLELSVSARPRELELEVGPMGAGRARALIAGSALEGLGSVMEKLVDAHEVLAGDQRETLMLRLIDAH